jgi:tetratricopeptide (TPR) repeat protein
MASSKTLNAKNLAALGADRLSAILLDLVAGDAGAKRRLRLELASLAEGGSGVAAEVRKRLATMAKSRSFVDWNRYRAFVADIEAQRRAIIDHIAPSQPGEAFELLWRLIEMAPGLYERCDDSNGAIGSIMDEALEDLGRIAPDCGVKPATLADKVYGAVCGNDHGQFDGLIGILAPVLGQDGLALLKGKFETLDKSPPRPPKEGERRAIGWGPRGPLYEDELETGRHRRLVRSALTEIADALGDVDAYAARYSGDEQANPAIAAGIAQRLLRAGRVAEALAALDRAEPMRVQGGYWPDWDRVRLDVLDALGRSAEAQTLRWALFEKVLHADYLRAYLKRLRDFDDEEAERRAMDFAAGYHDFDRGLQFLSEWPAPAAAATMVLARHEEMSGDHYWYLTDTAERLDKDHPLAATLILRALISFALDRGRTKRYPHAARHLQACAHVARRIDDWAGHPDHEGYVAGLKARHGRKSGFWSAA